MTAFVSMSDTPYADWRLDWHIGRKSSQRSRHRARSTLVPSRGNTKQSTSLADGRVHCPSICISLERFLLSSLTLVDCKMIGDKHLHIVSMRRKRSSSVARLFAYVFVEKKNNELKFHCHHQYSKYIELHSFSCDRDEVKYCQHD